jgi:hypothetical protein
MPKCPSSYYFSAKIFLVRKLRKHFMLGKNQQACHEKTLFAFAKSTHASVTSDLSTTAEMRPVIDARPLNNFSDYISACGASRRLPQLPQESKCARRTPAGVLDAWPAIDVFNMRPR